MQDCVKIGMWQSYRKQAQGKFDSGAILLPQPSCSSGAKRRVERTETDSGETLRADADAFVISEELKCLFEKSLLNFVAIYYVPIANAFYPYVSFSLKKKKKRSDKQEEKMSRRYFADSDTFVYSCKIYFYTSSLSCRKREVYLTRMAINLLTIDRLSLEMKQEHNAKVKM